ncbi:DUF554 domain-containing protein [Fundidesulfovibrio magnetotacticus]|uniref:DUF554 domain-containing protein n=1 Tax=Fundidesulfovibrio magnetotacticus TaxID=2730080 RepID=UPI001F3038EE|nr:DUF554 domain-containing protein [Fundidesulfovibrio magnetotacticus]
MNGACVVFGGLAGALLGGRMGAQLRTRLTQVFGLSAMGIGVVMTGKVHALPPVVLALVLGALLGELLRLESGIARLAGLARRGVEAVTKPAGQGPGQEEFLEKFVALAVLFCVSGTGVFGALNEGMTGDSTLLVVKAILDLFTSAVFAATLGASVALLAAPQLAVQAALYFGASLVLPWTTPEMIADFSAVGGLVLLATGLRICEIRQFAVAGLVPAMFLAMPLSALWTRLFG